MSELLTYQQVAKRYGLKVGTLYALVHERRIPHVKFSARFIRFRAAELDQWLAEHGVPASAPGIGTSGPNADRTGPVRAEQLVRGEAQTAAQRGTANGK